MTIQTCECCGQPNAWALIGPWYEFVCGECAEIESEALLCPYQNVFRMVRYCGCGRSGPVNYDWNGNLHYYCNSGLSCVP